MKHIVQKNILMAILTVVLTTVANAQGDLHLPQCITSDGPAKYIIKDTYSVPFSSAFDVEGPKIYVNSKYLKMFDPWFARFALTHECGHFHYIKNNNFMSEREVLLDREFQADCFAAKRLKPSESQIVIIKHQIILFWGNSNNDITHPPLSDRIAHIRECSKMN